MSQRWLSATGNRLEGGIPLRVSFQMLSGRVQRIPSNKMAKEDEEKTTFITSQGIFLLLENAVRVEKCQSNLSTSSGQSLPEANWSEPGSVCG
ncbi:hypothetical protein Tco_1546198 [Tanacetum coccineum]